MSNDWRNEPPSEKQKEKLRFFGCSWEEGITKGQASDALDECAKQFPEKDAEYYNRPATQEQLARLRDYLKADGEEPEDYADEGQPLTYGQAKVLLQECETAEREKELEYLASDEARIDEEMMRINLDYGDEYREVTQEEVTKAWGLVKSRQAELPDTQDLMDALEELFFDFKPKEPDSSRYDCQHCGGKFKVRSPKITVFSFSSQPQMTKEDFIPVTVKCPYCQYDVKVLSLNLSIYTCPKCLKEYSAAKSRAGAILRCMNCREDFLAIAKESNQKTPKVISLPVEIHQQIPLSEATCQQERLESADASRPETKYDSLPATDEQLAMLKFNLKGDEKPEDYADEGRPLTFRKAEDLIREFYLKRMQGDWETPENEQGKEPACSASEKSTLSPETRKILEEKLFELIADGVCDENDEKELKALAVRLGCNESLAGELLGEKFTEEFMPIKRRMEKNHALTDEDLEAIEQLKKKYAIELTLEGNAAIFRSIYMIESKKKLPKPLEADDGMNCPHCGGYIESTVIPARQYMVCPSCQCEITPRPPISSLMLNADESVYHAIYAVWHRVAPRGGDEATTPISAGALYITSQRLLFCGNSENTNIGIKEIVNGQFHSDFLKIDKSSGKSDLFSMTSVEARYILALIRALK